MNKPSSCAITFIFVLAAATLCNAQSWREIRTGVLNELNALKPKNTARYVYRVKVPDRPRVLPQNTRVDLIYKAGHYDFEYTAVRFEKREEEPLVEVSYFSYGSALAFWREHSKNKQDTFLAKSGTMPVKEFDILLARAVAYYDSDIEEVYIPPKPVKRNGRWYYSGTSGGSSSWSSGDGSIVLRVSDGSMSIVKDEGSLYGSDLKARMDNGFDEMRPNLFWKVFHDRVMSAVLLRPIAEEKIEELAIARLTEPRLSDTYYDYYRQTLFIELLGEYGSTNSLETLKRVSFDSGLVPTWHEGIQGRVSNAVEKISSRQ